MSEKLGLRIFCVILFALSLIWAAALGRSTSMNRGQGQEVGLLEMYATCAHSATATTQVSPKMRN